MVTQTEINQRIKELEAMKIGKPTAMELHLHRGGLGRVQRQEDLIFNRKVELQRQKLLLDLAELEDESRELSMRGSPILFMPHLPKRKMVRSFWRY